MRIFRLVATPLLLLTLVGLLIWGAFWGWRNLTAPLPTPEPTPCVTVSTELVNVTQVSVRVYNAGFTSGLASRVGAKLEEVGFNVIRIENTEERVTRGVIVRTNEANKAGIRLVSSYFAAPVVEYDDRVDGTIDILLASDWGDYGDAPLFQVSSGEGGTTCVPPEASPSAEPTESETPKKP
ncbi:LytR C-terminal domain-containing protein [Tessaracoccus antarcticus]|uniref:LytR C-terminal domain-containing protein n=1 Tax=Tessaracoccus antarcticus TaxID=2479848 RepID=UPI0013140F42|nr:LytR C-terminal domain-containing protein [Tessaracoccus antarcticus]